MTALRIATWNINSLRLRRGLLEKLVATLRPDVLCLQETKVPDALFPADVPEAIGLPHAAWWGMKGYNGVAVFSRLPLERLTDAPDWCGKGDCRHLAVALATPSGPVEINDFYVPAGGDVPDRAANPKFGHKLDFLAETTAWFGARNGLKRAVLVGDLNIAPLEADVWSHRALLDVVSHTPEECAALTTWMQHGFVDAVRAQAPAPEKLFTWWSYRNRDWRASNRGRRLDHVWVTPDLAGGLRGYEILKDARDWPKTSDHVPLLVEVEV